MNITVSPAIANLCRPVRNAINALGCSYELVRQACNSHLGKLKAEQTGMDKMRVGKMNTKKDTVKFSVKPGAVEFSDNCNVVAVFIAWHSAVEKVNEIRATESIEIPESFVEWFKPFAMKKDEKTPVEEVTK